MIAVALWLSLPDSLRAQERVRTAAAAPLIDKFYRSPDAFLHFGPFQELLTGSFDVQYTDNVSLAERDRVSDLSFSLGMVMNTTWVISHFNQLVFNFGGQVIENMYGNGRNQLVLAVAPNSKIELKLQISDVQVRLYDAFSYDQNPTKDPTATNTANLNSLTNTIGAVVEDNLNIALLSLSADYTYNNQSGTDVQGQTNPTTTGTRESFRIGSALTFQLSPTILYGVNTVGTRSMGEHAANVNSLNLGPFINGKLSRDLEFDLAGGATLIDTKPAIPPGYYFSAVIRYRVNRHWQVLFSGSHDLIFTSGTDLTEQNLFRLGTQVDVTRWITLGVYSFVNFGEQKTSGQAAAISASNQGYDQFGFGANLSWKLRKRWSASIGYDYIRRESESTLGTGFSASQNYIQNSITFRIGYGF